MKKANSLVMAGAAAIVASVMGVAVAGAVSPDQVEIKDAQISESLTEKPGDPEAGRKWFADRKLGNCLACHANKDLAQLPFHGEVGPPMDGVADRYSAPELRAILVNSKVVLGDQTIMPSFYKLETGARTAKRFQGKTILNGQQIEDIIAYLQTLKEE